MLGGDGDRGDEAVGLGGGEDLAPLGARPDAHAVAVEDLDRVHTVGRDHQVVANRLGVERMAAAAHRHPPAMLTRVGKNLAQLINVAWGGDGGARLEEPGVAADLLLGELGHQSCSAVTASRSSTRSA
jgi:hypothetical protein